MSACGWMFDCVWEIPISFHLNSSLNVFHLFHKPRKYLENPSICHVELVSCLRLDKLTFDFVCQDTNVLKENLSRYFNPEWSEWTTKSNVNGNNFQEVSAGCANISSRSSGNSIKLQLENFSTWNWNVEAFSRERNVENYKIPQLIFPSLNQVAA